MTGQPPPAETDPLSAVQRSALERALVDDDDARRYFALAGALDAAEGEWEHPSSESKRSVENADLLPAILLSIAAVNEFGEQQPRPLLPPSPWTPGQESSSTAVRRGARLALRWFDVSLAHVAAQAGVAEQSLVTDEE